MEFLLAEAADPNIPVWAQIAGGLFTSGFAVWYAWYTTTTTIPKQQEKHSADIKELVSEFRSESKEQRAAEAERMRVSTELARSGHAGIHQITAAVNELRTAIRDLTESRTAGG